MFSCSSFKFVTVLFLSQVFERYDFPLQLQRFVINKRLPKDNETLHFLGVRTAGTRIYLYLIAAKSIGLKSKKEIKEEAKEVATQTDQRFLPQVMPPQELVRGPTSPGYQNQGLPAGALPLPYPQRGPNPGGYLVEGR